MPIEYFAACALGLEEALQGEIRALGVRDVEVRRGGVAFLGDQAMGYRAALWLRSAVRLNEMLTRGEARGRQGLYDLVAELPWERIMGVDQTLAVDASVRDSEVTHSGFAALTVKDAVVDRFRRLSGRRPSVDAERPQVPLKLVMNQDVATLYRDLAGESLHKRGWRPIQVKSPLNEAAAAGILLLAGWDRASNLVDPMCGSGTFLVEAAMMAADRAPGLGRSFAFQHWPDFNAHLWASMLAEARSRAKDRLPFVIAGADRHRGALDLAERGAAAAGVAGLIRFECADAAEWAPSAQPAWAFVNPPWGERLGEGEDLIGSWKALGRFLHSRCGGATACVLSGNADLTRHLGLRASRKWPLMMGPIECRLVRYEIRAPDAAPGPIAPPPPQPGPTP